jgi:hypothetical protein
VVDNRFMVPNITTEDQQKVVKELGVIVNILGFKVIEVLQKDPRFKSCQGIKVCKFSKRMNISLKPGSTIEDEYSYRVEGGQLTFIPNPYGGGNVV